MPIVDKETYEVLVRADELVRSHNGVIRAALSLYEEHMREAEKEARAAYEAGASNGLITNNGYRQSAGLFGQMAGKAYEAHRQLTMHVDGYDIGDED